MKRRKPLPVTAPCTIGCRTKLCHSGPRKRRGIWCPVRYHERLRWVPHFSRVLCARSGDFDPCDLTQAFPSPLSHLSRAVPSSPLRREAPPYSYTHKSLEHDSASAHPYRLSDHSCYGFPVPTCEASPSTARDDGKCAKFSAP